MSKDIIIQEGGVNKNLNSIKKILTDEQDGGSCNWIPEDEAERGTKTITKNGTYKASDDDLYGYSKVIVNVKGGGGSSGASSEVGSSVVGTDPNDNTGNEYAHTVNENGEVEVTKIPSSIAVTRNPDKMIYVDGDTFNPSGIIVHAYYKDGEDYGTVQNSELSYEPMQLDISKSEDSRYDKDGVHIIVVTMVPYDSSGKTYPYYNGQPYSPILTSGNGYGIFPEVIMGKSYYVTVYNGRYYMKPVEEQLWTSNQGVVSISEDGYTGRASLVPIVNGWKYHSAVEATNTSFVSENNSFLELDNETINNGLSGGQPITVIWHRPADEKALTTTIRVRVSEATGNNSSGSGNDSGGEESGGGGSHGF